MIIQSHPFFDNPMIQSLLNALENSLFSIVITDVADATPAYRFLYVNDRFLQQTGYEASELKDKTPKILQGKRTNPKTLTKMREQLANDSTFVGQAVNYRKDGSEYIVRWSINPIRDKSGQIIAYISCQNEVTQIIEKEEEAFFLAEAINQSADAALITDLEGTILYANKAFSELTGYKLSEIKGKNTRIFKSGKMDADFYKDMWQTLNNNDSFKGIFLNRHKDGREFFEQKTITPIMDANNQPIYFLAISKDSSEVIQKTHHLEYKAYHDALTGLFNRFKFDEVLQAKLRRCKNEGVQTSLIIADIDNFKTLNDDYGHDIGDEVLKSVATLIENNVRQSDLVFRWGGEEFCILIDADLATGQLVAEQLRSKIAQTKFDALPKGHSLTSSFGVAQAQPEDNTDTFFKRADDALYQAKTSGKNQVQTSQTTS